MRSNNLKIKSNLKQLEIRKTKEDVASMFLQPNFEKTERSLEKIKSNDEMKNIYGYYRQARYN